MSRIYLSPPYTGLADKTAISRAFKGGWISEARPVWKPMHLQPVFADSEVFGGDVSAQLFENGLCIPSGSSLTDSQRDQVLDGIRAVFGRP